MTVKQIHTLPGLIGWMLVFCTICLFPYSQRLGHAGTEFLISELMVELPDGKETRNIININANKVMKVSYEYSPQN